MAHSTFTGPGELLLAPSTLGDLTMLRMQGNETWSVGRDAFLACTQGVVKEYKNQGFSKAMFSGEGMFVYKISGTGLLWMSSFGAILRKDVSSPTALRAPHILSVEPSSHAQKTCVLIAKSNLVTARRRRTIHYRQRPSRGLELQICP